MNVHRLLGAAALGFLAFCSVIAGAHLARADDAASRFTGVHAGISVGYATSNIGGGNGISPDGGSYGGYLGYDFQYAGLIWGAEGDLNWLDASQSVGGSAVTAKFKWDGSVRARLGVPLGNALPYVTAGVGFGGSKLEVPSVSFSGASSDVGFVWGGGVDFAINDHVTGRFQALHYDFGDASYAPGLSSVSVNATVFTVGLAYQIK